jgi:hypothetical protein
VSTALTIQSETVSLSEMSSKALVIHIVDTLTAAMVPALKDLEPYIREVWRRLDAGEVIKVGKDEYRTRKDFCSGVLGRTYRAVHYMLNGGNQNRSLPAATETDSEPLPDWTYEVLLDPNFATDLYNRMLNLPEWRANRTDGSDAFAIDYGLAYGKTGRPTSPEYLIPDFLKSLAGKVSQRIGMPVNYIQCHKYGATATVSPHCDPFGMIVPMLVLGQERTFRVGGNILGKNGKPFPRMASQKSMKKGSHSPAEEILLQHGSLLTFNGGRTFHSMLPAEQDSQFNPNGFDYRISLLFRYTTPAMRKFGTVKAKEHGSLEQYEAAKQEYEAKSKPAEPEPEVNTYPKDDYSDEQITATSRSHGPGLERLRKLAQAGQTVSYSDDRFHITTKDSFDSESKARKFLKDFNKWRKDNG